MKKSVWEHGSEFHWIITDTSVQAGLLNPWDTNKVFAGSGRDAIRMLVRFGREFQGWKRILLPSYLCPEVEDVIRKEKISFNIYDDDPRKSIKVPVPEKGEVLYIVNTFGIRKKWKRPERCPGTVIEDHTHDPWSNWAHKSEAEYCLASLRKTIPVSDGAVVWSPRQMPLPNTQVTTKSHFIASSQKLEAMLLKKLFLDGHNLNKEEYLRLSKKGEVNIARGAISGISTISKSVVENFSTGLWREKRKANYLAFIRALNEKRRGLLLISGESYAYPFSCILIFDNEEARDKLRRRLMENRIYPAILWPIKKTSNAVLKKSRELSQRILSIHCDGRYYESDMKRVAKIVNMPE